MIKKILLVSAIATAISISTTGCVTPVVIAGTAIGTSAVVATDQRTTGAMIDDKSIEIKAASIIKNNENIARKSKLEATSVNGTVLLTGQCLNQKYVDFIVENVKKVNNVDRVINKITIEEPISLGRRADDTWITTKVKTQLLFGQEINSGRFKVLTENGVVYLIGLVTKDEANRAVNVASQISGVLKVVKIFEYISENSKVKPIFVEDESPMTLKETYVEDVVEPSSSNKSIGTEDAPIYYEETGPLETIDNTKTTITPIESNEVKDNEVQSQNDSGVIVDKPVLNRVDLSAPATNDPTIDDSFIIE